MYLCNCRIPLPRSLFRDIPAQELDYDFVFCGPPSLASLYPGLLKALNSGIVLKLHRASHYGLGYVP